MGLGIVVYLVNIGILILLFDIVLFVFMKEEEVKGFILEYKSVRNCFSNMVV